VNFLVDNQLPEALCNFLTAQGHRSSHVLTLRMDEASDTEIWNYAVNGDWIVVSKDEDFLHLANRPDDSGKLLWVRIGNCRTAALLQSFERELPEIVQAFDSGVKIVEVR
jgi:predicted nuclease of predicted toxin-antitoxin system